jgi:N-acetylglutamate synthase-like GNAT family acetyltransferase
MTCIIRDSAPDDRPWIDTFLRETWGASVMVSRGRLHNLLALLALIAQRDGARCGLLTYRVDPTGWEIASINAVPPWLGTGTQLTEAVAHRAATAGCRRLWLVTTNDNLDALRFYQRRGFALVAVHRNAIEEARRLKPSIPAVGHHGIPLRDEIELERRL